MYFESFTVEGSRGSKCSRQAASGLAGVDPLTGKERYLKRQHTDEARALQRLLEMTWWSSTRTPSARPSPSAWPRRPNDFELHPQVKAPSAIDATLRRAVVVTAFS
jgi:hypothetical protein